MRIRGIAVAVLVGAFALPAAASADTTLGITTKPAGSTAKPCPSGPNQLLIDVTSGGPTLVAGPLTVPSSPGPLAVTHWAVNASGVTANEQVTLVVIRVSLAGPTPTILVVGTDTETVTAPASPATELENFTLSHPIPVQANDIIGQYASGASTGLTCYWSGIPSSMDQVEGLSLPSVPTPGEQLGTGGGGLNSAASDLNLAATLSPVSYDAALSLTASTSNAVVGQPALLTATVGNNGPQDGPVTFTDPIPAGLTVDYAAASSGSCSANAVNIVTCSLPDVAAGQSAKVAIVVTPTSARTYSDSATVSLTGGGSDPNPANNNATVRLSVSKPGAPTVCTVPKLGGAPLTIVKRVLPLLGCKVGKTHKVHSKRVAKGLLIGTSPGAGTYPLDKVIALKVSSGPPPKRHKKH
jgi:uncharacterized repeat protein (TIGR01451 family)